MRKFGFMVMLLSVFVLAGCLFNPFKGDLKVVVSIPQQLQSLMDDAKLATAGFDVTSLKIRVSNGSDSFEKIINLQAGQPNYQETFTSLTVGNWNIEVGVFDNAGNKIYTGSGQAAVVYNQTTTVTVSLSPVPGSLNVQVNIPEGIGIASGNVRLTHALNGNNNPQEVTKDLNIDGLVGTAAFTDLFPTSHQLYVNLYSVTGALIAGGEDTIEILPGRTITAVVNVKVGGKIEIVISWDLPPTAPTGLVADPTANGVLLNWNANPENNIIGYRVYRSDSVDGNKQLLNIDCINQIEYLDTEAEQGTYWYWVRAIADNGLASNLSEPVSVNLGFGAGNVEGYAYLADGTDHSGITVTIGDWATYTNANGFYSFTGIPVGNYVLKVEHQGYYANNAVVDVIQGETTSVEALYLYPLNVYGSVEGYAKYLDKTDHNGIAVKIQTLDGLELPGLIAETDANGYFYFPEVPVDATSNTATYIFTAFALNDQGYSTDSMEVEVIGNELVSIETEFTLRYAGVEVMIFADDTTPWNSNALPDMLTQLDVAYQIYTSADIPNVTLPLNKIVWIINDQPQEFYNVYAANQSKFDDFVSSGGTMLFEACDEGWNTGSLIEAGGTLPGGVINNLHYSSYNTVINPTHPMMQGVPIDLSGTYASHNWFSNLPTEHTVLTVDDLSQPTLVEYRYNKGRVISTGQPLEYNCANDQNLEPIYANMIYYTFNLPINPVQASTNPITPAKLSSGK